jgi:prepilin-type processing-associated H-X9-DG protein
MARSVTIPALVCPSSVTAQTGWADPNRFSLSNYAPSVGAQLTPDHIGCTQFPGNVFGTGPAGHANSENPGDISGPFSRGAWAAKIAQISDGTSNVIMVGEILPNKSDHTVNGWMHFNSIGFNNTTSPINFINVGYDEYLTFRDFGSGLTVSGGVNASTYHPCHRYDSWPTAMGYKSKHPGGAQFVFCDGSVQFLSQTIDYLNYNRLGCRRDGQVAKIQ